MKLEIKNTSVWWLNTSIWCLYADGFFNVVPSNEETSFSTTFYGLVFSYYTFNNGVINQIGFQPQIYTKIWQIF